MPRKGKRAEAAKTRWRRLSLAEGETSPPTSSNQLSSLPQEDQHAEELNKSTSPLDFRPRVISVQASHSQNDMRYQHRNRQCACMALTFLAYHSEGRQLNMAALDQILAEGDALYSGTILQLQMEGRFQEYFLDLDEVPRCISTDRQSYIVNAPVPTQDFLPGLSQTLQCLSTHVRHALLIVPPEVIAVFRDSSGRYGFFDSHSRTASGLPHPTGDGTAVMLTFTLLSDMMNVLNQLFRDRSPLSRYDFMPVAFQTEQQPGVPGEEIMVQTDPHGQSTTDEAKNTDTDVRLPQMPSTLAAKASKPTAEITEEQADKNDAVNTTKNVTAELTKQDKQRRLKQMRKATVEASTANRHQTYSDVRQQQKSCLSSRYACDPQFRQKHKQTVMKRYQQDTQVRMKHKQTDLKRYQLDPEFRQKKKQTVLKQYQQDPEYRQKKKQTVLKRYQQDPEYRQKKKQTVLKRYQLDPEFRQKQKQTVLKRYQQDPEFRSYHIQQCKELQQKRGRIASFQIHHKLQCALKIRRKYRQFLMHHQLTAQSDPGNRPLISTVMQTAISTFRETIQHGPTRVCTVCHRCLFPDQVKPCDRSKYVKKPHIVAACLTGMYVHICDIECSTPCTVHPDRAKEWICHSCHSHVNRGCMPCIASANKMKLIPIPLELQDLNALERQLIAKILPFAKIIALPKGQQRAVQGVVVCVPSDMEATVNALPRPNSESQLIQVKLKRQLKYKGHQHFYTVNMKNVLTALAKLKQIHSEYKDIVINEHVTFNSIFDEDDPEDAYEQQQQSANCEHTQHLNEPEEPTGADPTNASENQQPQQATAGTSNEQGQSVSAEEEQEELRPGLTLDTCMQPPDLAQEILSYGEGIFSIAPAQGKKPVGFFSIPKLEAMAFPVLFPTGENTLDEARKTKLSPSMYFNARLFSVDSRFARDQTYLFFAQFVTETQMAKNSMSIQLRKGKPVTRDGRKISNRMLQDQHEVQRLIKNKDATRFMQPLRGTPAYWEKTLRDLNAMIRQLGQPTFFLTFSAAEMRWPEVITAIKAQRGEEVDFSKLDWNEKCEILRSNPVTVMRMFEKRVDALLKFLLLSPARPIGEIEDYFYRVEFQARGSPHIHMMVWVKDPPEFGEDTDEKVCDFVDRYITCQMPDPNVDPELHKIVSEVQVHSRNHSKTCKRGKVKCRFGFPKLPTIKTKITYPTPEKPEEKEEDQNDVQIDGNSNQNKDKTKSKRRRTGRSLGKFQKEAKEKLQPVWDQLNDPSASFKDLSELLDKCKLSYEDYVKYAKNLTSSHVVLMKREPKDCWVNGYNADLLRAWNANMDIQYILDPYSCLMYMLSYVAKPEHEMTEYLNMVISDVRSKDVNERDEMKKVMQAYSKHRQVSAQESVARTCSLPLKKCSRNVIFLRTDDDALKMSLPMSALLSKQPGEENVWMSGLPEKYYARPKTPEFEAMCLADFASNYRVVYGHQVESPNVIRLQDSKGFIQKRTVGKPAVIRYARFTEEKQPEKYYGTLLKLYYPHRSVTDLKSKTHPTYEAFYKHANLGIPVSVCDIVQRHKKKFEGGGKDVQKAMDQFEQQGPMINAWNTYADQIDLEQLNWNALRACMPPLEETEQDDVPEYQLSEAAVATPAIEAPNLSPDFVRNLYRSLNETQASIFYAVRDWCLKRVWGNDPEQFFYFVSGGAGCGKSHVIKCIYEEATKILRHLSRFRDEADMSMPAVLLTAFTGTAAFNISGKTLHSLLKLPKSLKPPYHGLGNALDEVRATLSNAEILIIDEISMVSKPLFAYVNWRLQQIKGSKKLFGGMSVLAVGDFYQLPPVGKARPLCVYEEDMLDFWREHFKMVTLTEIMRQKDDLAFAELLNRLRVKQKKEALSDSDRAFLALAITENEHCPRDAIHIFATNKEVEDHNAMTVTALHSDVINIPAQDYMKDPTTGEMTLQEKVFRGARRELPDNIQAALGARVMVTRNLDVEDGIVNGTFGTIRHIGTNPQSTVPTVCIIGLELDNHRAGQKFRKKLQGPSDTLVYIERNEENMTKKGVVRRQFPIKLAFACTAHKVQGMTMERAVVSLKRVFESGMAYVALSRTTSLQGLHIVDFNENKIYADPLITAALENMPRASFDTITPLLEHVKTTDPNVQTLKIIHHNTEGLESHIVDIKSHHELKLADILCLTETHLYGSCVSPLVDLEGYNMFTRKRHVCYTKYPQMAQKHGGGVAIYCKAHIKAHALTYVYNVTDLEYVLVKIEEPLEAMVAAVYRPPNYSLDKFLPNMKSLLDFLDISSHHRIIVCGDFNEDLLSQGRKPIKELFESRGFTQLVTNATTEKHTLLDHIYISRPETCLKSGVLQTYYSYHEPVYCILTL